MAAYNIYDVGDAIEFSATFTVEGQPADPTTMRFRVRKPDGTIEDFTWNENNEVIHVSEGVFTMLYLPQIDGLYRYRAEGEGLANGAEERIFKVRYSEFIEGGG